MGAHLFWAKLFAGILASSEIFLEKAKTHLQSKYGPIDVQSAAFPFHFTTYYNAEMGEGILRQYVSFAGLIDPGRLRSAGYPTRVTAYPRTGDCRDAGRLDTDLLRRVAFG